MAHWLLKTEPESFGIDQLARLPKRRSSWDGVRNYQARNFLRDGVKRGDLAFLYHSSCAVPGLVGTVKIVRAAYPDVTAFDRRDPHYDRQRSAHRAGSPSTCSAAAPQAVITRRVARARRRKIARHGLRALRERRLATLGDAGR